MSGGWRNTVPGAMGDRGGVDDAGCGAGTSGSLSVAEVERMIDERVKAQLAAHDERVDALTAAVVQLSDTIAENRRTFQHFQEGGAERGPAAASGGPSPAGDQTKNDDKIEALIRVIDRMAKHLQILDAAVRSKLLADDDT